MKISPVFGFARHLGGCAMVGHGTRHSRHWDELDELNVRDEAANNMHTAEHSFIMEQIH